MTNAIFAQIPRKRKKIDDGSKFVDLTDLLMSDFNNESENEWWLFIQYETKQKSQDKFNCYHTG